MCPTYVGSSDDRTDLWNSIYDTCQGEGIEEIDVYLNFLAAGSEFDPAMLHGIFVFPGAVLASLADIAVMKANAYRSCNDETILRIWCLCLTRW